MSGPRILPVLLALAAPAAAGVAAQEAAEEQAPTPVEVRCPSVLGVGAASGAPFCDIEVQRDASLGVLLVLPPRRGETTLAFDLHNRHAYSEAETLAGRAYTEYQAQVAVATLEGEVIARGVVLSEFRAAGDLLDRVHGGGGADGLKAVAPLGVERVYVTVPAGVERVAVVGQSLDVLRVDGRDTFDTVGRPIAVLSNAALASGPR